MIISTSSFHHALLKPLLFGLSYLQQCNTNRKHEEARYLQQLLLQIFRVINQILHNQLQYQQQQQFKTKAEDLPNHHHHHHEFQKKIKIQKNNPNEFINQFHQILLDYSPSGIIDQSHSLIHSIVGYTNYEKNSDLQILSLQTLTLLCHLSPRNIAAYLGPTIIDLKKSILRSLTGGKIRLPMREAALNLLATIFELQEGIADRFLPNQHDINLFAADQVLFYIIQVISDKSMYIKRSSILVKILQILMHIWEASPGYHNVSVQIKQQDDFWKKIVNCLIINDQQELILKDQKLELLNQYKLELLSINNQHTNVKLDEIRLKYFKLLERNKKTN